MKPQTRRPVGRQTATRPRRDKLPQPVEGLKLPHERDESAESQAAPPDPLMVQAKQDIDEGQVDTDMRSTPGLDAKQRDRLVPGPGGRPPK